MARTCEHCCMRISGLKVRFGVNEILNDVHLHVNCGEIIAVVGPNGAGKTTLLRTILGEIPYTGEITFQVRGHGLKRPRVGYVPQKLKFDPDSPISVADLVALTISRHPAWLGMDRSLLERVTAVLARFSAEHLLKRRIGELSGGELQRVLLAIAMTPEPNLLLLDEPGSGVDVKGLSLFYQIVDDLRKKHDISVILVTHDLAGIATYVDRIVLINRSIIAEGNPQEVLLNEELMKTFGPGLWNVSCLLNLPPPKNDKNGHD